MNIVLLVLHTTLSPSECDLTADVRLLRKQYQSEANDPADERTAAGLAAYGGMQ